VLNEDWITVLMGMSFEWHSKKGPKTPRSPAAIAA
jgi:hypothetical protein